MADIFTPKQSCTELKLDPHKARERLRSAVSDFKKHTELPKMRKLHAPWNWVKGSAGE